KQFLMLINDWDGSTKIATSAINAWYYLCRYDIGKPELLKEKKSIILAYSNINRFSDYWSIRHYANEVNALFDKVKLDFYDEQEKQENKCSNKNDTNTNDDTTQDRDNIDEKNDSTNKSNKHNNEDTEENEDVVKNDDDEENEDVVKNDDDEENETDKMFDAIFNNEACTKLFEAAQIYNNQNLQMRLANIILAKKK
ncbi:MAG: hypothetical protein RR411_11915, partial [Chryseobacterium sp.]